MTYSSPDNIHFNFSDQQKDSMLYTFAYRPDLATDTVYIPVQLSGTRVNHDRRFIIRACKDSSTAIEGVHYKAFDSSYVLPANTGSVYVPLVIYNTDTLLQTQSVMVKFRLYPTPDFGTNLPYNLICNKLVFSNKLEEPSWWPMWMGDYYSRVKHQFFIIVTGLTSLSTDGLDAPKNLYFVSLVTSFVNDPFSWIKKNADKGYVLTRQEDGNYLFYNTATPQKTILYKLIPQTGKYFFIDENGEEVN